MRRILAIAAALIAAGALIALPATGDDGGPYKVRAVFDNGGFIVEGEEVRVAGATVGVVESVDVSRDDEIVSNENGGEAAPGKAVVVMAISDDAFKDFREDASCIVRPQSLIGEKYIDCTATQPRAPGSEPPPELAEIPDGERGAGQRLLPLENNGKAVDLDLIQNINRVPYRDRFRIILNDLGASLAARGDDLGEVIDRANPALRETNRVLAILAQQSDQLASLASDGDAVLEPLARNRTSITGFFRNAAIAGEATAEKGDELEAGLEDFPETLREVRLTMSKLKDFADQGTPLFSSIRASGKDLSRATLKLPAFAKLAIPAFDTLGDAAQASGPKLVAANPVLQQLTSVSGQLAPASQSLAELVDTFSRSGGIKYLMDFIYNATGSVSGYDDFGHFIRTNIQVTACTIISALVFPGCEATFPHIEDTEDSSKKKKKKSKKSSAKFKGGAPPEAAAPAELPPIDELLPELDPPDQQPEEGQPGTPEAPEPPQAPPAPNEGAPAPQGAGDATTGGGEETAAGSAAVSSASAPQGYSDLKPKQRRQLRKLLREQQLSLSDAGMLLDFLLGRGS